jgi:hypothetical protein
VDIDVAVDEPVGRPVLFPPDHLSGALVDHLKIKGLAEL